MMWNGWGMGMGLWMVLSWGLLIVALVVLIRWLATQHQPVGPQGEDPLAIARRRYAKGEITRDQFEQLRRDLSDLSRH